MQACNTVRAGYRETDIVPDNPSEIVEFHRPDNRLRGVRSSLRLQALIWGADGVVGGLIVIGSLSFTVELFNVLRDRAAAAFHTEREQITVHFPHIHDTPNAAGEPDYFEVVRRQAGIAVWKAAGGMKSTGAVWGIGENTVGVNWRNEPGQIDGWLGILKLAARDEKEPKVLSIHVTAHVDMLSEDNYFISADYMGAIGERLEKVYGCPVMMVQGAAGDIRPRYYRDNMEYVGIHCWEMARKGSSQEYRQEYVPQSHRALERIAEDMFWSVDAVHASLVLTPLERVEIQSFFCRFAISVPDMERAEEIAEEAEKEDEIDGRIWLKEVRCLLDEGIQKQYTNIEIQYLFVNQGCLCGVPNKTMCQVVIDVWKEAEAPFPFFNGHTNGCSGYLLIVEEYDKGGYEVLWSSLVYFPYHGQVTPLNRDTAGKMVAQVVEGWRKSRS